MRTLLIEGWRGVNHSFALVNQNQILRLAATEGLRLFHRDMPFFSPQWSREANADGFPAEDRRVIDALPDPGEAAVDAVYRICSPFRVAPPGRAAARAARALSFVVTELGLGLPNFASEADRRLLLEAGEEHLVLTPSEWAWDRLVEYGLAPERVRVVPHGVDPSRYRRLDDPEERRVLRSRFGIREDETVFLHVGAPLWAKGIDLLLRAAAILRGRGERVRIFVKDQRALYGTTVEETMRTVAASHPALRTDAFAEAVTSIPGNLSPEILSALFGVADAYVSPYRAEGFNLPVLEAIACGRPLIVTSDGATADFCSDDLAVRIGGRFGRAVSPDGTRVAYVEPDFDVLVDAMGAVARGWRPDPERFARARDRVLARFTWERAASGLLRAAFGEPAKRP